MKGALLYYGGSEKTRNDLIGKVLKDLKLKEGSPDLLVVEKQEDKKSIGIDQIKNVITFLSKKPFVGINKAAVIRNAEAVTTEGQNALLKNLEEPPVYATIILSAKTQDSVLTTISSRCRKIEVREKESRVGESSSGEIAEEIISMDPGKRLAWAAEAGKDEKDVIVEKLEKWVSQEREDLTEKPEKAENIRQILKVIKDLETTNINTRLSLETLLLQLK